jgi:mannose-6-phosphate isomerase-like protein (cupin superfamily)
MDARARIIGQGQGVGQPFMPGETLTWKVTAAESAGTLEVAELALEADVGTPEHVHHQNDEAYYVVDGTYRFKVGPDMADVGAGAFVYIPRGTPHAWLNVGDRPGRVVMLFTPGGMAGYFEELQPFLPELLAAGGDMSAVDPETLRKAGDVMQRYHYELVGPPLVR